MEQVTGHDGHRAALRMRALTTSYNDLPKCSGSSACSASSGFSRPLQRSFPVTSIPSELRLAHADLHFIRHPDHVGCLEGRPMPFTRGEKKRS